MENSEEQTETKPRKIRKTRKEYMDKKSKIDKEKRISLQKAKKEGTENQRRMYFFEVIKKRMGYNNNSLSAVAGISPQMLSWWSVSDDARLSSLITVCEKMGIEIKVSFKGEEKNGTVYSGKEFELEGDIPEDIIKTKKSNDRTEPFLEECSATCVRLKPLIELIKETKMSLTLFSEKIGSDYANLCRWLKNDDLKISKLYNAAKATGKRVVWTANPLTYSHE